MTRRTRHEADDILGAIDVGTNAVRLEVARVLPDGSLETLHTERDPVRPGEGVFKTGSIHKDVADRLISALKRYASLCKRYGARVRAVATSALREARNRDEVVRRARKEAGVSLEIVSGREEARLICLGVLRGKNANQKSLCIDLGGGSTEVISAEGQQARQLWSIDLGAVRLTETFAAHDRVSGKQLQLMRNFVREVVEENLPLRTPGLPTAALGSSGTIGAVVSFARSEGVGHATLREVSRAVEELAEMDAEKRRKRFDPRRADIIVAGAVILEAVLKHLRCKTILAVDRGLREGILYDLVRRRRQGPESDDEALREAAVAVGRRFQFGEAHGQQVARLALSLFESLATVHQLPASARPLLEVAALLHDVGHAVSYQKHHRHSHYLIVNADLPGLTDRERQMVGTMARFHRRSEPEAGHEAMAPFTPSEVRIIRKCATLLRIADALDRSHHQPVSRVSCVTRGRSIVIRVHSRHPVDLELWDAAHELALFREVFGRSVSFAEAR